MKRVAIVGFAPSWTEAPFTDLGVDIWMMNFHHEVAPRVSRIFELHAWDVVVSEGHVAGFAAAACPVYMQTVRPEIPASVAYPLDVMRAAYTLPGCDRPYFVTTASYMIALAIQEGYEEIAVYGIDMAHDSEYSNQRPSCEFFLGVAVGRGITVTTHPASDILKTAFLYAYEDRQQHWMRTKLMERQKYLETLRAQHAAEAAKHAQAVHECSGALENNQHIAKVWT